MNPFFQNVQHFIRRLTLGQKLAVAMVLVGGIGVFASIAFWAGQTEYALLFGNLDPSDANKVVEALQTDGLKYEIKEGGGAIYVPREDVYELRLRFAGEGLVSEGPMGYELFDQGTLGMTDFMQKLNFKRALEGEMARTVASIRQVEVARVHLVMPERSPFRETQTHPTASVVLKLSGAGRLSGEQIDGITQLVAGAVEGLSPSDVTILDTRGNLLSNSSQGDAEAMISSTQLEYQRAVESHLTKKGQSMLDQIVGPGNAIVRVAASIDFSRTVSESNVIDPESATVIAEETMDQTDGGDNANSSITNYEISRTVERSESATGQVSYLTVSVILNEPASVPEEGEEGEAGTEDAIVSANYTERDLAEIEDLVKNAVGFQPDRGDRFAIHQTSFDTTVDQQIAMEFRDHEQDRQIQIYLRYGLMALALLAALWLLRSAMKKVQVQGDDRIYLSSPLPARKVQQETPERAANPGQLGAHDQEDEEDDVVMVDDFYTSKLSPEAKARLKAKHLMYEEIKQTVNEQPDSTADLLRNWMVEDLSAS